MKTLSILKIVYISTAMSSIFTLFNVKSMASNIKEEKVTYTSDGMTFNGYLAYDESIKGKRPAILVVPEWWGLNDYPKMRARKLAELGYIALAVDLYGDGKIASNPKDAQAYATPYYKDPSLAKNRLDAALAKLKEFPQTDPGNIAAIGYCFGGYVVLNAARLGSELKGVVSFHGGLGGAPFDKNLLKAKTLVCQGESDKFVTMTDAGVFKHKMDSIGAAYTFKSYPGATHAFTNPESTANGKKFNMPIKYDAAADKASWNDMKVFFAGLFKK
jgi:dienelactone hydrolase